MTLRERKTYPALNVFKTYNNNNIVMKASRAVRQHPRDVRQLWVLLARTPVPSALSSEHGSVLSLYLGRDVTWMFRNLLKATQTFLAS